MKTKIYLAIPFSGIEDLSFRAANEVASYLINKGYAVYSPISHSYPIWKTDLHHFTHYQWMDLDEHFIDWSEEIWVVRIQVNGIKSGEELVQNSKGVQQELTWGIAKHKNIRFIDYYPVEQEIVFNGQTDKIRN